MGSSLVREYHIGCAFPDDLYPAFQISLDSFVFASQVTARSVRVWHSSIISSLVASTD